MEKEIVDYEFEHNIWPYQQMAIFHITFFYVMFLDIFIIVYLYTLKIYIFMIIISITTISLQTQYKSYKQAVSVE